MKKLTILITANAFSSAVLAQTEEVKKDEIFSDGNVIAKIEKWLQYWDKEKLWIVTI